MTSRDNTSRIAIIMTDGKPNRETSQTDVQADLLKQSGVVVVTVAIGSGARKAKKVLNSLSSNFKDYVEVCAPLLRN